PQSFPYTTLFRSTGRRVQSSYIQIQIAVVIIVDESQAQSMLALNAGRFSGILERIVLLVVKQNDSTVHADGQIDSAIVVVISSCATSCVQLGVQLRLLGDFFEFSVAKIMVKT